VRLPLGLSDKSQTVFSNDLRSFRLAKQRESGKSINKRGKNITPRAIYTNFGVDSTMLIDKSINESDVFTTEARRTVHVK
jgi:hypothetical protein